MHHKIVIDRRNNSSINIHDEKFTGDIETALKLIQDFADDPENNIEIRSFGRGYGEITINGTTHNYNPYGIDIFMILEFCKIDLDSAQASSSMSFK